MGKNQGYIRLNKGFLRNLTKSELKKGYLFISKDKKILNIEELFLIINNKRFRKKKLDGSGRVYLGKKIIKNLDKKTCYFKLDGNLLLLKLK